MTIQLTCKRCNGTGAIPNEHYKICKVVKSDAIRRHFRIHAEALELEDGQDDTEVTAESTEPETCQCPQCEGEGVLEFDEAGWELRVIPDNGEETE